MSELQLLIYEFAEKATEPIERRLRLRFERWREVVLGQESFEHVFNKLEEIEQEIGTGAPYCTDEELCVDLAARWVQGFVDDVRTEIKAVLSRAEKLAFLLGEHLDRGVRRGDVAHFLNRDFETAIGPTSPELQDGLCGDYEGIKASRLHVVEKTGKDDVVLIGKTVLRRFVNYRPVPGSILPENEWFHQMRKFQNPFYC